jgi:PAS domain S-box-containing protein
LDADANVIVWNRAAERISGYPRDEVVGHAKIWQWLYPDPRYREQILKKARAIIDRGSPVEDLETVITCRNGEQRSISWHSQRLVDRQGKRTGSVAIGRDVSQRRALERHLRSVQKAEALGALASGVAHDFNNVINVIKGYAQLAARKCPPEGSKLRKYVDMIQKLCGRAEGLVEQVLSFTRRQEQPLRRISLQPLIEECVKLLRTTLPPNIRVELDVDPETSPIQGDATRLQQLLLNLCTNAFHAMERQGGELHLGLREATVSTPAALERKEAALSPAQPCLEPGKYVVLSVRDTGMGIEPEALDRIFEPYYTTKHKGKGTGLGLAIAQSIAQSHQGAIFVESVPGQRTEFSVHFPAANPTADPGTEPSHGPASIDPPSSS